MSAKTAYQNRLISPQEQVLYDHLLACAEAELPEQLIDRFRALFIDGVGYSDRAVVDALDGIISSREIEEYFHYILNRCCHILINRWHCRPQFQAAVPELVALFEQPPCYDVTEYSRARHVRLLRQVVAGFTETEQYLTLKRVARVAATEEEAVNHRSRPLGTLIPRYPYLYEHCLVSEDSPEAHQQNIRRIQAQAQRKFEINLSHYVTYRVRQSRLKKHANPTLQLRPVANPTLLSDRELVDSLNQFSGKVQQGRSYSDSARIFLQQNQMVKFGEFKRELYDYLTTTIDPAYGNQKFNKSLCHHLQHTLPNNESQQLNDFLVVRTCSQLLNFMVLESSLNPQHFVFLDLINNLGPLFTTGLLLKLVLICQKVKPYLERRLSVLFSHYEAVAQGSVEWLIKVLENLNIALSVNFGSADVTSLLICK